MAVPAENMQAGLRAAVEQGVRQGNPNENEIPDSELNAVKRLFEEYSVAREFDKTIRQRYSVDRRYAAGTANPNWASDANILGAYIDILASFLYAKDPDVSVRPAARVTPPPEIQQQLQALGGDKSQVDVQKFAETGQIVVSQQWRKAKLKKTMKKMLRASLSISAGWFKALMYSPDMNPLQEKELSDLRDNLAKIQALQADLVNESEEDHEQKILELQAQIEAVQAHAELSVKKGLCIDFARSEDIQVSLDVVSVCDYLDADWISQDIYIKKSDAKWRLPRLTPDDIAAATSYVQRQTAQDMQPLDQTMIPNTSLPEGTFVKQSDNPGTGSAGTMGGADKPVEFIKAIELWDHRDMKVKTMVEGVKRWARDAYPPPQAASRFYPFFQLALYEVDGQRHPQSWSGRGKKLQDEYSSRRSSGRKMRERSIPGTLFDAGQLTPEEVDKIRRSEEQEFTPIRPTTAGMKVADMVAEKPVARIDPLVFDTKDILYDMNVLSGVQEAQASGISQANTATEADINQSGFASRTGADRDTEEDMLTDLAQYTLEIAVQGLSAEEVQRIAGPYSVWPVGMDVDDILTMVDVEIKAGTTGKPRAQADKEAWATLLPIIMETIGKIQLAQSVGDFATEQTLKNILNETLKRLDDRLSIESILAPGVAPVAAPGMPGAPSTSGQPGAAPPGGAAAPVEAPPTGNGTVNNPGAQGAPVV